MTRAQLRKALEKQGVKVCGTTEDFNGVKGGLWISGEHTPHLFDYWMEFSSNMIDPALQSLVNGTGWFFEWNDPGTLMVYKL